MPECDQLIIKVCQHESLAIAFCPRQGRPKLPLDGIWFDSGKQIEKDTDIYVLYM